MMNGASDVMPVTSLFVVMQEDDDDDDEEEEWREMWLNAERGLLLVWNCNKSMMLYRILDITN